MLFNSLFLLSAFGINNAVAQHCAPITESYLSEISVKKMEDGIKFKFEYIKDGGQIKESYQAYLVIYSDSNLEKIATLLPQQAIDAKLLTIIDTRLIKRNKEGAYEYEYELNKVKLAETMIKSKMFAPVSNRVRLAVFIPLLTDKKYSIIDGLPEDKHECNPRGGSALLFDTIPQKLYMYFTSQSDLLKHKRLKQYYMSINGTYSTRENNTNQ